MKLTDQIYIIAELSANHNNNFQLAKDTILAMKESGADAVKFQTYTPDSLSLDVDNEYFGPLKQGSWKGIKPYDLFKRAAMPWEWQDDLAKYAISLGLDWLSSPFDFEAVDFLETINCPVYKIASFEIFDIPLIEYVAKKKKPIIISTGIAEIEDIELAVSTCKKAGNKDISILKCTSAYPAPFKDIDLKTIPVLSEKFGLTIGLSDHTSGYTVALGAVALGANIIEKHFVLDRESGGVDSFFSMEPEEFKIMTEKIRELELALGDETYKLSESAIDGRNRGRSLFVVHDIKKDEVITEKNIKSIRPAAGLHPKYYYEILGKKAKNNIPKGTPLSWELIY